jgi:hypothetical protein
MVHDDKHAIYLALTFDVKAQPVDTKAKPLRLQKLDQDWLWTQQVLRFEVSKENYCGFATDEHKRQEIDDC